MPEIIIPKSTKKTYYYIFKNISIGDIFVLGIFLTIASGIALAIPNNWIIKMIVGLFISFLGFILITKINDDTRLWEIIIINIKYLFSSKKTKIPVIFSKNQNNKNILELKELSKQKYSKIFVGALKISANDINLLNDFQQQQLINDFAFLLKNINLQTKLIKTEEGYDLDSNKNHYLKNFQNTNNPIIEEQKEILEELSENKNIKSPNIYLLFLNKNISKIESQISQLKSKTFFANMYVKILEKDTIQNVYQHLLNKVQNSKYSITKSTKKSNDDIFINQVYSISNLPIKMPFEFWLSDLFKIENSNVIINIDPISKTRAKKRIDSAINKIKTNLNSYNFNPSKAKELKQYEDSFEGISEELVSDTDRLNDVSIYILMSGNKYELKKTKEALKNLKSIFNWKYNHLIALQYKAVVSILTTNDLLNKNIGLDLTSNIFATGLPLPELPLIDEKGFFLGETLNGKPLLWDLFNKTKDRPNSNCLILGESGSGKSFLTKKIISNLINDNNKIFILDPEREYKNITETMEGQWLDASSSNNNQINPLQIYAKQEDESNSDAYDNHIAMLDSFLSLVSNTLLNNDTLKITAIKSIKELYNNFNINPSTDISKLKNTQFPIFSDLADLITTKIQEEKDQQLKFNYQRLISIIELFTEGQYSKYWNGHTSININETVNLTCFDLQTLTTNSNQKIINIQMFLLLRQLEQTLIKIRASNLKNQTNKKIIIVVDEAHLLIDEKNPFTLDFLYQTMKRIRKYNGSLIVISQNVADFTTGSEAVKKKFKGIINNAQYWFIGGLQQDDLNDLNDLYRNDGGLSDTIRNFIANANQGLFWFKVSKQLKLSIQVSKTTAEHILLEEFKGE